MNNKIIFGQYYDSNSWLHHLDPRTKIVSLLFLISSLFIIDNPFVLLSFTLFLLALIFTTKTPIKKFFQSINMMTYIIIFTFVMQTLTIHDGDLLGDYNLSLTIINLIIILVVLILWFGLSKYVKSFKLPIFISLIILIFFVQYYIKFSPTILSYNIKIYSGGLAEASLIALRIICFLFLSSLLTLSTKPTEINYALDSLLKPLSKLKINTGTFTMMISVTLRFVPTLILEADKVLKSQASRGADFKEINIFGKVFQMVSLIIPLFVITYKKAVDLTFAMEARGYIDNKKRSSLIELKYKVNDYLTYFVMLCLFIFSIISLCVF